MIPCRAVIASSLLLVLGTAAADDRFSFPSEDLVLDAKTGLVWMRCSHGQRVTDGRCTGDAVQLSWTEAQALVDSLASPDCPWRIPEFHELRGLIESGSEPVLDLRAFPDTPNGWFWSNVRAGGHSQYDCFVDFSGSSRTRCNMGGRFYLRAVMSRATARVDACAPESAAR